MAQSSIPVDLHKQLEAQAEQIRHLQQEVQQYRTALDTLPMLMNVLEVVDANTYRILIANALTQMASGHTERIEGKYLQDVVRPEELPGLIAMYRSCIESRAIAEQELQLIRPDGIPIWLRITCVPMFDEKQTATQLLVLSQDITQGKNREVQEQVALREQQQLIEEQALRLAELSTPLLEISNTTMVMPLIGSIDSHRVTYLFSTLLHGVSDKQARNVILDITGVPVVDTQVANILIQSARAVKLLGAQVILSGIRPEVAQVLVGLGVDFSSLITRSTLQSAIATAMDNEHR